MKVTGKIIYSLSFEYDMDEYDYSIPVVIDNWIDAFFLVMVSYFSIRKVKYSDVF